MMNLDELDALVEDLIKHPEKEVLLEEMNKELKHSEVAILIRYMSDYASSKGYGLIIQEETAGVRIHDLSKPIPESYYLVPGMEEN